MSLPSANSPIASAASYVPVVPTTNQPQTNWTYEEAFSRNIGLISEEDQQRLRNCRVAIPGMGGVGGVHLITLARLGIGAFNIADADEFSVANFNRQYGANTASVGASKTETMASAAKSINPEIKLRVTNEFVTPENVDAFLTDVDVLVDSVDFFSIDARRLIFREAAKRGIWAITAGPIGFSTAWLVFDPNGMSFDQYFDLHDEMSKEEKLIAFAVGLTPKATQRSYIDLSKVDLNSGAAPSVGLACQLASGAAAAEVVKVLTGAGKLRPAPYYQQFDVRKMKFVQGRLLRGNRGPLQQLKRRILKSICNKNVSNFSN